MQSWYSLIVSRESHFSLCFFFFRSNFSFFASVPNLFIVIQQPSNNGGKKSLNSNRTPTNFGLQLVPEYQDHPMPTMLTDIQRQTGSLLMGSEPGKAEGLCGLDFQLDVEEVEEEEEEDLVVLDDVDSLLRFLEVEALITIRCCVRWW